jgi:hypothetical protein
MVLGPWPLAPLAIMSVPAEQIRHNILLINNKALGRNFDEGEKNHPINP